MLAPVLSAYMNSIVESSPRLYEVGMIVITIIQMKKLRLDKSHIEYIVD